MRWRALAWFGACIAAALAGCASVPGEPAAQVDAATMAPPTAPNPVPEIQPGLLAGYLGRDLPDSLKLLPPPPAAGTPAFRNDQAVSRAAARLKGTPRYTQATADADLAFPHAAGTFSCALGVEIAQAQAPYLYQLLRRSMTDAGLATYTAKNEYKRTRPFVHYKEATCTPQDEKMLRGDGSYPSGHAAIGWAWALILTELAPDRADAILGRGRSFAESRLVCNAHWQSDILEGKVVAAGAVARLHASAEFRADLARAGEELAALRRGGAGPGKDCEVEAEALEKPIKGVL